MDIVGLVGTIFAVVSDGPLDCTADTSSLSYGLRQVALAAADLYRDARTRAGFTPAGSWLRIGECLPFQHVERIVPESVVEGMLVPSHTAHLFRFHSGVEIDAGDALYMRVGNYPGSVWLVDGAPARTTWRANVAEVTVIRQIEAEAALAAAIGA